MPTLRRLGKLALATLVLLAACGAAAWWWMSREEPVDTRFSGAYRLGDDVLLVSPRSGETLRYRIASSGESLPLHPAGSLRYEGFTPGESADDGARPAVVVTFDAVPPTELVLERAGEASLRAERIPLREETGSFESDGLTLRAKLVLPPAGTGEPPYPAVVLVHGSGDESAVDGYFYPYLFAPAGIATFVYDKRGTGASDGDYTQNFHLLARDVIAAVEELRTRPEIDPERIHLAGYSQGGWIAPLAASRLEESIGGPAIASLLVGYGPMVPIIEEDRWGWVHALREKGFGDDEQAMARAQRLHDLVVAIVDHGEDRWDELRSGLEAARGEPWFEALAGSDSTLGFLAETSIPFWLVKPYARWKMRPVHGEPLADRLYDPEPVVRALEVPSLWLLGGADSSMPTGWTLEKLRAARAAGAPVSWRVWPEAEHGIWRVRDAPDGSRLYLGQEPDYLETMVSWLRRQSGLPPTPGAAPAAGG